MTDLDALLAAHPAPAESAISTVTIRPCKRHSWQRTVESVQYVGSLIQSVVEMCGRCGKPKDIIRSRRGKQSRNYGNRAELSAARTYGGTKVGHAGGPVDIRGKDFNVQVKTHRRSPPVEWTKAFSAMAASNERLPRLLLRFVRPGNVGPEDYFVIPAKAWLDWYGRDE